MKIGERIRQKRKEAGLTQRDVARAMNVTHPLIQIYESGKISNIPFNRLSQLAQILNTTVSYLIDGSEESDAYNVDGMLLSERIRQARELKGFSQRDLASAMHVTHTTIYKYENGVITNIPINRLEQFSNVLGVSKLWLIGVDDDPTGATISEAISLYAKFSDEEKQILDILASMPKEKRDLFIAKLKGKQQ